MKFVLYKSWLLSFVLFIQIVQAQVTPNINSGNPAIPFPQFLDYGPDRKTLASVNAPGVTHAEMEQRTREAWQLVCNNTSVYPNTVVSGVTYLYPTAPNHCTCVEGDGYYLLGAALMGDKKYFDGYYMWAHDRAFQGTKRFIDGQVNTPNYNYSKGMSGAGSLGAGTGVMGGGINGNSATDGDVDVALALLIAYKQWGPNSGIVLTSSGWGGKELNYKEEALSYIRAMVDTAIYPLALPERKFTSGDVGFDGYLKGGDSQGELTDWALTTGYQGIKPQVGQQNYYFDYSAPAWFRTFRNLLESEGDNPFYINQFKRVEASCDWLMGQHYSKNVKNIPYLGKVAWAGANNFTFSNYIIDGEDFRGPWRTIMNYVWHGNPDFTWNPATHQAEDNKANTFEFDMGLRYSKFLKNNQDAPWNNACRNIGDLKPRITFKGPYTLVNGFTPDGTASGAFPLNWIHGTGAASAIVGQDFELMGDMFRHCVIAWDAATGTNLDSRPIYFHEWFRLAGMLTLAGNFHSPINMVVKPNIKVYHKMDKTFAFTGDQLTYTVSYRNYGSVDGAGTVVKFGIPAGFEFVSTNKGALSGDSVVWNVGVAKGFKSGGLAVTMDSMKVTLKIGPAASGRFCTSARVFCTNGLGWTSNEYPNNITAVMERNCVDVVKRALRIEKTASRKTVNPATNGDVVYKIKFENSSDAGWINGGRPGVRLAFAHEDITTPTANAANVLKYRIFHDAAEPYIDYGNYRVSYFMNDPSIKCYAGTAGCTTGWTLQNTIAEGVVPANVKTFLESISPGTDVDGSWNQRIVLQFSPQLATITQHLQQYAGSPSMVHEGGTAALRGVWRLFTSNYSNVNWTDDWSWDATKKDGDDGIFYPIGDDYTNPNNIGLPINSWHKSACQTTTQIMKKVLVEEWDGYTWRRIYGNGPLPGRDIDNVLVLDTLPSGVTLKNFIRQNPLGKMATTSTLGDGRTVITWTIPKMQINQKDSIVYTASIAGSCPGIDKLLVNKAWIQGNSESAISEGDSITITCNPVTICPTTTTLIKTSDKTAYTVGQTVKYTLNYTQTQGSIANPNLNSATDWTIQSGSGATFSAGKITLAGGSKVVTTHDYSYGTNTLGDGIEGTIQVAASEGDFAIVVRNDVYITIKPGGGTNPTSIDIFSGTTKLNTTSFSIPFTAASYDFRIKLNAGTLSMWLVSTGTEISGAASIIQTGIPVKAGNAGVAHGIVGNNPYASHTVSSWRTHMDVAYDVEVSDPVPAGITLPVNISAPGTVTTNVIKWSLASGKANPMPYGTTKVLSWEGTFSTCAKVTNVAYVNTKGLNVNEFGVCYDIACGTAATCVAPVSVTSNPATVSACTGKADTLKAIISPGNNPVNGYKYVWYKSGTPPLPINYTSIYSDKIFPSANTSDAGTWILRVEDGTTGLASCYKESPVVLTVNTPPADPVTTLTQPTCSLPTGSISITSPVGTGLSYSLDSLNYQSTTSFAGLVPKTYKVWVKNATGCTSTASVIINPAPGSPPVPVTTVTQPSCTLATGGLTVNSPSGPGFTYSMDGTTFQPEVSFSGLVPNSYTITAKDPTGCNSTSSIIINPAPVKPSSILSSNLNDYCSIPSGITLTASDAGAGVQYEFFNNKISQGTANSNRIFPNAIAGSWKVKVTNSGGCIDSSAAIVISKKTVPVAQITSANPTSYCPATNGSTLTALNAGNGAMYEWFKNSSSVGLASTTSSLLNATTGNYTLKVSLNGCDSTSGQISVIQSANLTLTISGDTSLCVGDTLNIATDQTFGLTWTLPDKTISQSSTLSLTSPSPGIYKAEFISQGGCKGIDSVEVKIDPLPTAEILPGQNSYCASANGTTLNAKDAGNGASYEWFKSAFSVGAGIALNNAIAGDYQVKVIQGNCSSTSATTTVVTESALTVNISTPETSYCVGDPGVTLTATTSTSNGNYNYEWFRDGSSVGTPSSSNQLQNAIAGLYSVKAVSGLCSGESDTLRVSQVTILEPQLNLFPNSVDTCVNSIINITATGTPGSIEWFENNQSKGILTSYSFTLGATTDIRAILTTTLSCAIPKTAQRDLNIKSQNAIIPSVTIDRSQPSVRDCEGEPSILFLSTSSGAGNNATYQWFVNGVAKIGETDPTFINVQNWSNNTKVELELTKNDGCVAPANKAVKSNVINLNGNPSQTIDLQITGITDNSVNGFLCPGELAKLKVLTNIQDPNMTYFWRNKNGSAFADPSFSYLMTETLTDSISVSIPGCYIGTTSASSAKTIKIAQPVTVSIDDNVSGSYGYPICEGSPVFFTTSSSGNVKAFNWYKNDTLLASKLNAIEINNLKDFDLIKVVAVSDASCATKASDSTSLKVDAKPKTGFANGTGPLAVCSGNSIILKSLEKNPGFQFSWKKDSVLLDQQSDSLLITDSGKYTLSITNGLCFASTSISVVQTTIGVKAISEMVEFFPGMEVPLKAIVTTNDLNSLTYSWSPAEIMLDPTLQNTNSHPTKTGFVKIVVRSSGGCTAQDSIELKLKDILFIPNAIVPGTNDINAFWGIKGAESYPELDVKVFNRWGSLVYEQIGYTKPWDGTYNSKDLPTGTYYYVIKDKAFGKPFVGDLTIVR